MDRVSGWYKRWTQLITFIIGVAVAIGLNINSIEIVGVLWNDDVVRSFVADAAQNYVEQHPDVTPVPAAGASGQEFVRAFNQLTGELDALKLPIGWQGRQWPPDVTAWWLVRVLVGWLITALAVSLGAQFSGSRSWATS